MASPRVDSAMCGSSISFLTRASIAWLHSCFGSCLCMLHDAWRTNFGLKNKESPCIFPYLQGILAFRSNLQTLESSVLSDRGVGPLGVWTSGLRGRY